MVMVLHVVAESVGNLSLHGHACNPLRRPRGANFLIFPANSCPPGGAALFIPGPSCHMRRIRAHARVKGEFDMNRTVIIGAIVVLLGVGGGYQFWYKPNQEAQLLADAQAEAAAAAAAEAAAAEAAAAEAAAAEAAAAEAAAAEAAAAAAAATEAAAEGAAAATEAVTEGAAAATEAATDAAAGAAEVVTEGAAAVTDAAAAALDPANFNADGVVALIDGSSLDDATKTTLKTAVEAARANPALVADTVAQVKAALGM
jgi:hypothetical protein